MDLTKALELKRGDLVSLVGAGGKTTTMFRLAGELASLGWNVITTTTTMIWREDRCGFTILEREGDRLLDQVSAALADHDPVCVASRYDEAKGKLIGIDPSLADALIALPQVDAVIVEADGAKGRSLKAPADYEPVIASSTSILIPVAAVDAIGRPLDDRTVHRPEIVVRITGSQPGETVTAELMSTVLLHPEGGLKNAPPRARVVPLINKVSASTMSSARQVARLLVDEPRVERILLSAVAEDDPVKEVWNRVAAVVLAAGGSSRFGSPKQLLSWKGQTLLEYIVDTVLASSVQETVVVLGHEAERIGDLLRDRPLRIVVNEEWESGQSSSVRVGIETLPEGCDACLFVLADQPNVTTELIDAVVTRYRQTLAPIVAPVHRDRRGNPVLFDQGLFSELLKMRGDEGGRQVIQRHQQEVEAVEVGYQRPFLDIDTVEEYERAKS
jgi:molybdenum cofactor cytidylyltransferase